MARSLKGAAIVVAAITASAADAAATDFAGSLDLRAGYGNNPYLTSTAHDGSALFGGTLSAGLTSRAARSTTTLTGVVDVEQNLQHFGRSENFTVSLGRSQQLTERFSLSGNVGYANTINPGASYQNTLSSGAIFNTIGSSASPIAVTGDAAAITTTPVALVPIGSFDPAALDLFTIGQRSERYSAGAGATWTPTARDQFTLNGSASHVHYKSFNGNYDQYGGGLNYLRTINDRTRVGLSGSYTDVESDAYPAARSYSLDVVLIQRLSARWMLNAQVGGILPRDGIGQKNSLSLGFSGSLCGDYGRSNVCFTASRQSAPTGIGGLRTDLQAGVTLSYALDEHDQINGGATVDHSGSGSIVPTQNFYQANVGYSHQLSRRISIGGSGRYQRRGAGGAFASASGYAVTLDVITRFGHGS